MTSRFEGHESSRRRFLKQMGAGIGAAGVALYLPESLLAAPGRLSGREGDPKQVLVVGAGLAGLTAAWELREVGHEVTVLEARARPGGRVHTWRDQMPDGLYAEAGALGFSHANQRALRYIDAFGLERVPWGEPGLRPLFHLRGERFAVGGNGGVNWPYELSDEEQELGQEGILQRYLLDALPDDPDYRDWAKSPLMDLDATTAAQIMREAGASQEAVSLAADTVWFGGGLAAGSALSVTLSDIGLFHGPQWFTLKGGNDRLPRAIADRLDGRIHYGREVTRTRDTGEKVVAETAGVGGPKRFEADHLICTIPAPVLRDLSVEPALPPGQAEAVAGLPYADLVRVSLQLRRGFWFKEGVTGGAVTDLAIGGIFMSPAGTGPDERHAMLTNAAVMEEGDSEARIIERTAREIEKVHPRIRDYLEGGRVKAWADDPYAGGALSFPTPGDVERHLANLQAPHGRIHFGGEHTSILRGTMEGAIESGLRVAREVHERA